MKSEYYGKREDPKRIQKKGGKKEKESEWHLNTVLEIEDSVAVPLKF